MTLEVGTNCYTDIAEANEIIDSYLSANDPVRKYWDNILDDNEKAAIILGTTQKYDRDSMRYRFYKKDKDQPLQFPRNKGNDVLECPLDIKIGLLIQGIKTSINNKSSEYQELKAQGIKNYKIKDASVEFFENTDLTDIEAVRLSNGLYEMVFNQYFKDWVIEIGG